MKHIHFDVRDSIFIIKYFIVFSLFFLAPFRSIPHATILSYFIAPLILWGKDLFVSRPRIVLKLFKYYVVFSVLIMVTAVFAGGSLSIPFERFTLIAAQLVVVAYTIGNIEDEHKEVLALWGIILATLLFSAFLFHYNYSGGFSFMLDEVVIGDDTNIIGNKNFAGNNLFVGFIAALLLVDLKRSNLSLVALVYIYVCILFTLSLKIIVVSTFLLIAYLFVNTKNKIRFILLLLPLVLLISNVEYLASDEFQYIFNKFLIVSGQGQYATESVTDTGVRKELMDKTMHIFYSHPIFGIGLENNRNILETYSHNTYVELLAGGGVVLFISYIFFFISAFVYLFKKRRNTIIPFVIFVGIIYISNALRIYDNLYVFLIFLLVHYTYLKTFTYEKNSVLHR